LIRLFQLVIALTVNLACIQIAYSAHFETGCNLPPERRFIDAVFNHDFDAARIAAKATEYEHSLIPSASFYEALVDWVSSLYDDDISHQKGRLSELRKSVKELKNLHSSEQSASSLLAWGLAGAHTARILLFEQHVISGYHLGNQSIENLQQYSDTKSSTTEGRQASRMAIGLHQIYSNAVPDALKWAEFLIRPVGDIDQGRELIELTLQDSTRLSPEAARILLLEVPWSTPGICDYLELAGEMAEHYPLNPDFSIAFQGILLRCGNPHRALKENMRISTVNYNPVFGIDRIDYPELLKLGRLRAYAETGNIDSIQQEIPVGDRFGFYQQYALSNALDISGSRNRALALYKSLSEDKSAPNSLKKSSQIRMKFPYVATDKVVPRRSLKLLGCEQ